MKFASYNAVRCYLKCQGERYFAMHEIVKTRYWSCDLWAWVTCWSYVLRT